MENELKHGMMCTNVQLNAALLSLLNQKIIN